MKKKNINRTIYNKVKNKVRRLLPFYLFTFLPFLFFSCADFNDATEATHVNVQLVQPTDFTTPTDLSGKTVTMALGSQTIQTTTDANGLATFNNIIPDVYTISASWTMTGDEYKAATGSDEVVSGATVSGSLNSQLIKEPTTLSLQTNASVDRDIVIGKVYYAGSRDNNRRNYMAGKYIELFNQSDKEVDVSGLYIGLLEAEGKPAYTLENLHDAFADSIVLLKQVFRIPVDANFKVKPGGTVIITNSAIDHSTNDSLESDLSHADFEVKDVRGRHQNNPAVPAMEVIYNIYKGTSIMNLTQSGPVGVVLFRTNEDVAKWPKTYKYGKSKGMEWLECPIRFITDGMEALRNKATGIDTSTKRLYNSIDAGYTYINSASGRNGEVVYRKTLKTENGHKVLVDTNNSTNDFEVSTTIKPREYDD